jgi:hypothetical protein
VLLRQAPLGFEALEEFPCRLNLSLSSVLKPLTDSLSRVSSRRNIKEALIRLGIVRDRRLAFRSNHDETLGALYHYPVS